MKNKKTNVVIVHGWAADPDCNWFQWLKTVLEEDGVTCTIPKMPNSLNPVLAEWVEHLHQTVESLPKGGKLIFVGHSLGCVTIAHYLGLVKGAYADGCVFVAGFSGNIRIQAFKEFYETQVHLEEVKKKIGKSISILSVDDSVVPQGRSREFAASLGAEVIAVNGYRHFMGSEGVTKLPIILPELQKLF